MEQAAVWRPGGQAAADAVRSLEKGGMDLLEIPSFLRRQAD